jgi:hypothetical protein
MLYSLGLCVLRRTCRQDYETLFHVVILSKHHHQDDMTFEQIMEIVEIRKVRSDKRKEKIFNKVLNALGHIGIDIHTCLCIYIYICMYMYTLTYVCIYIKKEGDVYIYVHRFFIKFSMYWVISV